MKIRVIVTFYFVSYLSNIAFAETENEVKRGLFPFMAFVYSPDETVIDMTGSRFLRGAVLIRLNWLLSAAIDSTVRNDALPSFPRKTFVARLGAIAIDTNFTLNEDEHEQEREVIQVVRPYDHNAQWWNTDITLMKTLLPFNATLAVGVGSIFTKHEYVEKTCTVLVYAKRYHNSSGNKILMQLSVELLPPSEENCGKHFREKTMTCAADSDENKNLLDDSEYCQGNSGGPLICEGEIVGLQTYIDNNCKQPHLYQLLSAWEGFISCGMEEKCQEEKCANICKITNKDTYDKRNDMAPTARYKSDVMVHQSTVIQSTNRIEPVDGTADNIVPRRSETTFIEADITTPSKTTLIEQQKSNTEPQIEATKPKELKGMLIAETKAWPNEKLTENRGKQVTGDSDTTEREANVEARLQNVKMKVRSASNRNTISPILLSNIVCGCYSFYWRV